MASDPIHVWFHVAAMGHYREVVQHLVTYVNASLLYDHAETMNIVTVGDADLAHLLLPRWRANVGGVLSEYEYPTLRAMWRHARENNGLNLYIHTKGVSKPPRTNDRRVCDRWREIMAHHCIGHWRRATGALSDHDTAGVWYRPGPFIHYTGNFFWARSDYLRTLPEPVPSNLWPHPRINAEVWPLSGNPKVFDLLTYEPHLSKVYGTGSYRRADIGA